MAQTTEERKTAIQALEASKPSEEAQSRKSRSMARLMQETVPTIESLPVIVDSKQVKIRGTEEIAHRAIAVCITAVKGEGLEQSVIDSLVQKYGAEKFFSPEEADFIKDPSPSQQDRIKFSWRYECLWGLMWSLGYVDKLEAPTGICDVKTAVSFLRDRDTATFIKDAKLRPITDILDEADLIYRYDWAVVSARLKGMAAPSGLEGGVVLERHYALNWLIGYMNQAWDDISTDT